MESLSTSFPVSLSALLQNLNGDEKGFMRKFMKEAAIYGRIEKRRDGNSTFSFSQSAMNKASLRYAPSRLNVGQTCFWKRKSNKYPGV